MAGLQTRKSRRSKRSHFGCSVCKYRKLKCDEVKPVCGSCKRSSRNCSYNKDGAFRIVGTSSSPVQAPKEVISSPDKHHIWVDIPKSVSFVAEGHDPENPPDAPLSPNQNTANHGPSSNIEENDQTSTPGPSPEFCIASQPPSLSPSQTTPTRPPPACIELLNVALIRHYKDGPSKWLDAFDTGAYFSHKVPVKAASSPLLKSSICTLAAKHLLHTQDSSSTQHSRIQTTDNFHSTLIGRDWNWHSVQYYDEAIRHLQTAIGNYSLDLNTPENTAEQDCIFASVAILSIYELMDKPGSSWCGHLDVLPLFNTELSASSPRAFIHRPIFWNLARQDFLCSFISETQTRLRLNDERLWQNAGLAGDSHGVRLPLSPSTSTNAYASIDDIIEDRKSNELTWLLCKIMNFLTSGDALDPEDYAKPPGQRSFFGITQEHLLERWYELLKELDTWYNSLPASFSPITRTKVMDSTKESSLFTGFDQVWFEVPQCAATMQGYHMARILLLVNRPQESTAIRSTVSARLRSYRQTIQQVSRHSREICGISLADPCASVRVHSVQPLFVAGQVFHDKSERQGILTILENIEQDLGWSTSHHVARLRHEWSIEGEN